MSKYAPHKRSANQPRANSSTICQKCLKTGHFIYECKSERPYVSRPSRTEMLENPKSLSKLKASGVPSVEVPEEFKTKTGVANRILEEKEKEREKGKGKERAKEDSRPSKRRRRSASSSSSSDSSSGSESDSDSGSSDSGSDSDSGSESDSRSASSRSSGRRRRVPRRRSRSRSVDDRR